MKTCTKCQTNKKTSDFYFYYGKPVSVCKECARLAAKKRHHANPVMAKARASAWRKANRDKEKLHSQARRLHDKGRSTILLASARRRAKLSGLEFTLDRDWILSRLQRKTCELTGWVFDLADSKHGKRYTMKSPSIDRIDSSLGYTKSNCRIVCSIANMARGELSDEELLELATALVKTISSRSSKEAGSTTIPKGSRGKRLEAPNTLQ